jgi:phosphoribosyl-ATP pyrophosphohydrolase
MPTPGSIIAAVFETVEERKRNPPAKSYVVSLLNKGTDTILCKVAEETGEVIKAAREQTKERTVKEIADLYFHTMVLMADRGITLAELEAELAARHGISGIDEKNARPKS